MPNTPWIINLRSAFSCILEYMEEITKKNMKKREYPPYRDLKFFIIDITSDDSKSACGSMLKVFLNKPQVSEILKENPIVIQNKDSTETGKIFSEKEIEFKFPSGMNGNQDKACNLAKIYPLLKAICIGSKKSNDSTLTQEDKDGLKYLNETYNYFICSFAHAIANYCLSSLEPTKETSQEIYRKNINIEIPSRPSRANAIDKFLKVFSDATEDDVIGGIVHSFIGKEKIQTLKQVASSIDSNKITSFTHTFSKALVKKDGKGMANSVSEILSTTICDNIETEEDTKASDQEF